MIDNQERENVHQSSNVHEGFISPASLLNDLINILIYLLVLVDSIAIFLKSDCHCKNSISQ